MTNQTKTTMLNESEHLIVSLHLETTETLADLAASCGTLIDWLLENGLDGLPLTDAAMAFVDQVEDALESRTTLQSDLSNKEANA